MLSMKLDLKSGKTLSPRAVPPNIHEILENSHVFFSIPPETGAVPDNEDAPQSTN